MTNDIARTARLAAVALGALVGLTNGGNATAAQAPGTSLDQAVARRVDAFAAANGASRGVRGCAESNRGNISRGDLDGDGVEEAALPYNVVGCGGGTHIEGEVAVFCQGAAGWYHVASVSHTDNAAIDAVSIRSGRLVVRTLSHGPNDARCCPSVRNTVEYRLVDNRLVAGGAGTAGERADRAARDGTPSKLDHLFAGIEKGCAVPPALKAFFGSLADYDIESNKWRPRNPPIPPTYRDTFRNLRLREMESANYTLFSLDVSGRFHGIPVTSLSIDMGNGNGIFNFSIELDSPAGQAEAHLGQRLHFEEVMNDMYAELNGVRFSAHGERTLLSCYLSG